MKGFRLLTVVLAAVASFAASAQDTGDSDEIAGIAGRPYISIMGTRVWEDSRRGADAGYGGTIAIGKQFGDHTMVELTGYYVPLHVDDEAPKAKLAGYGAALLLFPSESLRHMYAKLAIHYSDVKDHPTDDGGHKNYTGVDGELGAGYMFGPINWLGGAAFRLEALVRLDDSMEKHAGTGNGDKRVCSKCFLDEVANFGIMIPIGSKAEAAPPPAEPAPVAVVPVTPPADSDGDGVTDDLDQCPGTPAGTPVDEKGCPLPAAAPAKTCKTPEPGQPVTLEGCAAGDVIVLRGVNFEFNKATLTANARTILDGVADALTAAPNVNVEIGGHTDSKGSDEYNQKLSERRASAVVQYLKAKGIDAGRMTSKGYGESMPVADNNTDEGRELNRRVELKIAGGGDSAPVPAAAPAESAPAAAPADAAAPAEAPAAQ